MDIFQAAADGNLKEVRRLIETEKVDPNAKDNSGRVLLHQASFNGHLALVQYLIETAKADPQVKDQDGWVPLHPAVQKGHLAVVQYLIETAKADPQAKDQDGWVPLHSAAQNGHLAVAQYLIEKAKADPQAKDKNDRMPLHIASLNGRLAVVQYLIEKAKADPQAKDNDGWVPLHYAVGNGHLAVVQYLIETVKVDPQAKSKNDRMPLHDAAGRGHLETVQYLIEKAKVDPQAKDNDGWVPLHSASYSGRLEVVQYLIEKAKADPEAKDNKSWVPLCAAALNGHLAVVQYLIETAKVDPNIPATYGWTPLHHAADENKLDVVCYLINFAKADPDAQEKYNLEKISKTKPNYKYLQALALMIAVEHDDLNNVKKLYNSEIEILCLQELQYSLLATAASKNFAAVVQWIQQQRAIQIKDLSSSVDKDQVRKFIDAHIKDMELLSNFHLYDALVELDELLKLEPNHPLLLLQQGKVYVAQSNYPKAKGILRKLCDAKGDYAAEACFQLGKIYVKEKDYRNAREIFSKIVQLNTNLVPEAYFELGNLEQQIKNWPKASENYDKALETDKKIKISDELKLKIYQQKALCFFEIGIVFRNQENFTEAKKYFEQAIDAYKEVLELDETNEVASNNLRELPQYFKVNQQKIAFATLGVKLLKQPTHYEFACFSKAVYHDDGGELPKGWTVVGTAKDHNLANEGYFGVAYFHEERNILIIAHRGTDTQETDALVDDLWSDYNISLNEVPQQWQYAKKFYLEIRTDHPKAQMFVTGHSLGACLGALTAWEFKAVGVLFDPPGSLEIIQTFLAGKEINRLDVPVTTYLSYPDIVNTANHQVGDVKHVPIVLRSPDPIASEEVMERLVKKLLDKNLPTFFSPITGFIGSFGKSFIDATVKSKTGIDPQKLYAVASEVYKIATTHLSSHSMEAMFDKFDADTGMPLNVFKVKAWPSSINQMVQYEMLLQSCPNNFPKGLSETQHFKLKYTIGYEIEEISPNALHINRFEPNVISFLHDYKEKGIAEGIDEKDLKKINIEEIEFVDNDQIVVKDHHNIFVLRQYLTDKLPTKNVHADLCPEITLDANGSEQEQFEIVEEPADADESSPTHSKNSKEGDKTEPPKKSSGSKLSPWFSSTYLLGASHAGYQLISTYLSSFNALPQKIEEKETSAKVSAVVATDYSDPYDSTNSQDHSTKTTKSITGKPVSSYPTLHDQLYLLQYMIGCMQNSRFWPVVSHYLDWMQSNLPWNQPYPLTKETKTVLQNCRKVVRAQITRISQQKNTRIGESEVFEEKLLPLQNSLLKLAQMIDDLLRSRAASSAQFYEVVNSTSKIQSDLDDLDLKQLNKTLRYAKIEQARLEKRTQRTGCESETHLLIKQQKHKNQKWSIEKTSNFTEVGNPKIYTANNDTIFWSDSLHKSSQNLEPAVPLITENTICKK